MSELVLLCVLTCHSLDSYELMSDADATPVLGSHLQREGLAGLPLKMVNCLNRIGFLSEK